MGAVLLVVIIVAGAILFFYRYSSPSTPERIEVSMKYSGSKKVSVPFLVRIPIEFSANSPVTLVSVPFNSTTVTDQKGGVEVEVKNVTLAIEGLTVTFTVGVHALGIGIVGVCFEPNLVVQIQFLLVYVLEEIGREEHKQYVVQASISGLEICRQ